MSYPSYFNPKNSLNLFGLQKDFRFLKDLYTNDKLPKVLMLSGNKGVGKSTLINHFLYSIFESDNYDIQNNKCMSSSAFLKQFQNNIFSNILFINGADFKSVKVDDIRNLKSRIFQSSMLDKDRFIILDDVELFNANSLNSLLKIIEEPSKRNYFFLINNKSKPILETVKSRTLEIKIILNEKKRLEIIDNLIKTFDLEISLEPKASNLSPGIFIKFNHICKKNDILPTNDYIENLSLILNLFRKEKDILFIHLAFFISDLYFDNLKQKNIIEIDKIFEIKNYIFDNLNNFHLYNINKNSLLNAVSTKLNYE